MPKTVDIHVTAEPGQTVNLYTDTPDGKPIGSRVTGTTKARNRRTLAMDGTYVEPPVDPPPPPPPPTTSRVFGPGIMADSKGEMDIGRSTDCHVAFVWDSAGGTPVRVAINQRFGPDGSYSDGNPSAIRWSIQGWDGSKPTGTRLAELTMRPQNPHVHAEDRTAFALTMTQALTPGRLALVLDNLDPNPSANWMSANCIWHPSTPQAGAAGILAYGRQGPTWDPYPWFTPVFDIEFADGHHEGQGFFGVITGYEVLVSGATQVRERFTPSVDFTAAAAWFRVHKVSGPGPLYVQLVGPDNVQHVASVAIDSLPSTPASSLTGSTWVRAPFTSPPSFKAGNEQRLSFWVESSTQLKVMPIREVGSNLGEVQSGIRNPWKARSFPEGVAEKNLGSGWGPVYTDADLQFWLEAA